MLNLLPYMTKRVVRTSNMDIFKALISSRYNGFDIGTQLGDDQFTKQVDDLCPGCFVFVYDLPEGNIEALSMHKFKNALSTMISKDAALSLHMRYLNESEREASKEFFTSESVKEK